MPWARKHFGERMLFGEKHFVERIEKRRNIMFPLLLLYTMYA